MSPCDVVTERLALGESLGDAEAHVATCPACSRLIGLPRLVAAAAHAAEPNAGFAIRTTTGARTKLAVRRRNRALGTVGLAATAALVAVWAVRTPVEPPAKSLPALSTMPSDLQPVGDTRGAEVMVTDDQLATELVRISDFHRVVAPSPAWDQAEAPLSAYKLVVHEGAVR